MAYSEGQVRSYSGKVQKYVNGQWVDTGESTQRAAPYSAAPAVPKPTTGAINYGTPYTSVGEQKEGAINVTKDVAGNKTTKRFVDGQWVDESTYEQKKMEASEKGTPVVLASTIGRSVTPGGVYAANPLDNATNKIYDLESNKAATTLGRNASESQNMLMQNIGEAAGKTGAYTTSLAELAAQNVSAADQAAATIATSKAQALQTNVNARKTDLQSALSKAISNNDVAGANAASTALQDEFGVPKTDYTNVLGPTASTTDKRTQGQAKVELGMTTGNASLIADGWNLMGWKTVDADGNAVDWTADNPTIKEMVDEITNPDPVAVSTKTWITTLTNGANSYGWKFTPSASDPTSGTWTHTGIDGKTETKQGYSLEKYAGQHAYAEYTGGVVPQLPWVSDEEYQLILEKAGIEKKPTDATPVDGYTGKHKTINPLNSGRLTGDDAKGYLEYSRSGGKLSDDMYLKYVKGLGRPLVLTDLDGTDQAAYNTYKNNAGTSFTGVEDWILNGMPDGSTTINNTKHAVNNLGTITTDPNAMKRADTAETNIVKSNEVEGKIRTIGSPGSAQRKEIYTGGQWVPYSGTPVYSAIPGLEGSLVRPVYSGTSGAPATPPTTNYGTIPEGTAYHDNYDTYVKAGGKLTADSWYALAKDKGAKGVLAPLTVKDLSTADQTAYNTYNTVKPISVEDWYALGDKTVPKTTQQIIDIIGTGDYSPLMGLKPTDQLYKDVAKTFPNYTNTNEFQKNIGTPVTLNGKIYTIVEDLGNKDTGMNDAGFVSPAETLLTGKKGGTQTARYFKIRDASTGAEYTVFSFGNGFYTDDQKVFA